VPISCATSTQSGATDSQTFTYTSYYQMSNAGISALTDLDERTSVIADGFDATWSCSQDAITTAEIANDAAVMSTLVCSRYQPLANLSDIPFDQRFDATSQEQKLY